MNITQQELQKLTAYEASSPHVEVVWAKRNGSCIIPGCNCGAHWSAFFVGIGIAAAIIAGFMWLLHHIQ